MPRPARPILRELVIHGPLSRTTLARRLGLSVGSLSRLTKPLVASGVVVEQDVAYDPVNGRPTRPLRVVVDGLRFVGIKLTSDRVYAVLTNLRADVLARGSAPLPDLTPEEVVERAGRLADELVGDGERPVSAGITLGGDEHAPTRVDEGEFLDSGLLGWRRVPVRRLMAARLGVPCVVRNDVTALAYAHQWFGEARGLSDFAVVTIGEGIGYALFVHGRAVRVTEADLGEFGHQILDPGGPLCPSGHRGCAGAYLPTRSVLMAAAQGLRRFPNHEEVLRLAAAGDPVCSRVVGQTAWALGALIANLTTCTTVKTVIVAGEAVGVVGLARGDLDRGMADRRRDPEPVRLVVQPHDFGDWARGAAVGAIRAHVAGRP
ncbi:ROK family transcriptional regulator [Streptomyces sp. 4N509B]|uniref:ROK family transcriptional regulator n=1 Tax=Streptomyces sp. 4N509B TaxID=3457413 RepID=UPI003FD59DAB